MNAILITGMLALGQSIPPPVVPAPVVPAPVVPAPVVPAPVVPGTVPASTALDGVWRVVAAEVNGRPETLTNRDRSIVIRNNCLTLPGVAALHGTIRLELGPRGTLLAVPAAAGTGNRADPTRTDATVAGTSGTGVIGAASGVYVRTADYLVLTIGDPSTATATGTGTGGSVDDRPTPANPTPNPASAGRGTVGTVGQPPVSLILRRATGVDAPPSTAASETPTAVPPPANAPAMRRVSSVIGSNVTLSDGSTAGQINDVVYGNDGAIDYAVIGNNGVFAAVPWSGLVWGANGLITLPLTRDQFRTIPTFGANAWSHFLTDAAFTQRLQTTFSNFRDANGRAIFNQTNMVGSNRMAPTRTTTTKQANVPGGTSQGTNQGTNRPTTRNPNGSNPATTRPAPTTPPTNPEPVPAKPPVTPKVPPNGIR